MSRPSARLLEWLRDLLKQRGMNSAQLAERAGLPRQRVRRILSGSEPMLVDELLAISQVLEVQPADLGLAGGPAEEEPERPPEPEAPAGVGMDPWGNHPRQLVEAGFALGCDFSFVVDTTQLKDSGVPQHVLHGYNGGPMRIQLDAAYHQYNAPRYDDHGVTLTLSFDALYDCTFPWSSFLQLAFVPAPPDEPTADPPDEPEEPQGRPRLRLVT